MHFAKPLAVFVSAVLASLAILLCPNPSAAQQTLAAVKSRNKLQCGISPVAPGFSYLDDRGVRRGFDIDICRAVAASVFGSGDNVEYLPLDTNVRFQAIQSGGVDLLSAQTTWTFSRANSLGIDFGPIVFHDGQGVLVPADTVNHMDELAGATVCLLAGTTNLENFEDYFRAHGLKYEPIVFENSDEWRTAFFAGRCDALSADSSVLGSVRVMAKDPGRYRILPETISQEPLAPALPRNDSNWRNIVSWTIYALAMAEKKGITQNNVDSIAANADPESQRLLGILPGFGKMLGLSNDWAHNAIKTVGNYGEIFDRNVGASSALKLPRGANKLWTEGGLIYSPPFR
jgi:general L-amino acid transport system substrate-binding protein